MTVHVGDDIEIDSEKAGTPPREGTVLEVIEADWGTRYRIQWDDGHESTIHPLGGTIHKREPKEPEVSAFAELWR
jgi:hypothetical protein